MARQRSHSIAFKRQVAQEFIARESLYALSKRHMARSMWSGLHAMILTGGQFARLTGLYQPRSAYAAFSMQSSPGGIYPLAIAAREIRMRRSFATTLASAPSTKSKVRM